MSTATPELSKKSEPDNNNPTGSAKNGSESGVGSYFMGAMSAVGSLNPIRRTSASADKKEKVGPEPKVDDKQGAGPGASSGNMLIKGVRGAVHAVNYLNPMAYDYDSDDDTASTGSGESNLAENPERTDVLRKKESALAVMLRCAKNKYVEKGLEGKITIQILYGLITSGEFCSVTRSDAPEDVDADEMKRLGVLNFKAVSAMDAILANLNRRAKQYDTEALRFDVTLTQGVVFGVSIPLIYVGFQTSIQFEVTAQSLIQYRKRKHKLQAFQKKLRRIPQAQELVEEVIRGGFSREVAQRAVVATEGRSETEALRWAADHDKQYAVTEDGRPDGSDEMGTTSAR